jgi:hypothetical protein
MDMKWREDHPGPLSRIQAFLAIAKCPADNPWDGRCGECPMVVFEKDAKWELHCGLISIKEKLVDMVAEEKQACDDKV